MADVREQRIYCAEQIVVPQDLPAILKNYSKEVIRSNPENIIEFSANFKEKEDNRNISEIEKPNSKLNI